MKQKKLIIIVSAIIGFVIISYLSIRRWIKSLEYGLASGVKINRVNFQNILSISILLPFYFYNPTPFNLVVSNMNLDVFFDGLKMSEILFEGTFKLKSKQRSNLPFNVNLNVQDVINYLAEKGENINDPDWIKKTKVTMIGTIDVDLGIFNLKKVPFNYTDSLKYYIS